MASASGSVGLVGLGLIGGSIGMALRPTGMRVIGTDLDPANERAALGRGCVEAVVPFAEVVQADVVFISVPPAATASVVLRALAEKGPETVVTDCASVKGSVIAAVLAERPRETQFVGGHPMAGHEKSGPAFASAWMYRGARWLLTPLPKTSGATLKAVRDLIKAMGAEPVKVDAKEHDRHVALLSHLPHVLAATLVRQAASLATPEAGAGSWKDLTRVAGVDPEMWSQILAGNAEEVGRILAEAEADLARVRQALADPAALREFFEEAKRAKEAQSK